MSKTVRLQNNIVVEIIPDYATPVAKWYGPDFAAQCMDAPEDVEQGWVYNPATGKFAPPRPEPAPEPSPDEDRDAMLVDLMTEVALLKLGIYEM